MTKRNKKDVGISGEKAAAIFLKNLGYKILDRNFQKSYSEIDIVALDHNTLVFVEVKTRYNTNFGTPEEAITPWKLRSLIKAAYYYKMLHPNLPSSLRIDAITVILSSDDRVKVLNHYKNITL